MNLSKNGITIQVDDAQVMNIVMERFLQDQHSAADSLPNLPRIGTEWPGQGGIYAGIMRGRDGEPDYHLIVGPAIEAMPWAKAKEAAAALETGGHKDFSLPFRVEQALQFANVPELFEKERYWSCEQHASLVVYAWMQYFDYGFQDNYHKSFNVRARAVRRLII